MSALRYLARWLDWVIWLFLGLAAVVAGVLGFIGLRDFGAGQDQTVLDVLYADIQLFVLQWNGDQGHVTLALQIARLLAPAVAFVATTGAFLAIVGARLEWLRLKLTSSHVIVCGCGYMGSRLAESLREQGWPVVIVERDPGNEFLPRHRKRGTIALVGDARDDRMLHRARVRRAAHILALTGDDAVNAEVVVQARALLREHGRRRLSCLAHISDPRVCELLRAEELSKASEGSFALDFLNVFDSGARLLLEETPPFPASGIDQAESPPHVAVVGTGLIAENLLLRIAREWRTSHPWSSERFRGTLVGARAEAAARSLSARVGDACDLRGLAAGHEVRELCDVVVRLGRDARPGVIYVGLEDGARGISVGLALSGQLPSTVPIVVAMTDSGGLASFLHDTELGEGFENVTAFRLLDRALDEVQLLDKKHEALAQAIHRSYVEQRLAEGASDEDDVAMATWDRLRPDLRQSNRQEALHISTKLRAISCDLRPVGRARCGSISFTADEIERLAEMEHERFLDERFAAGWTYAPVRDVERRTSPYLVSWDLLPDDIKVRDRQPVIEIPKLVEKVGLRVVRARSWPDETD